MKFCEFHVAPAHLSLSRALRLLLLHILSIILYHSKLLRLFLNFICIPTSTSQSIHEYKKSTTNKFSIKKKELLELRKQSFKKLSPQNPPRMTNKNSEALSNKILKLFLTHRSLIQNTGKRSCCNLFMVWNNHCL